MVLALSPAGSDLQLRKISVDRGSRQRELSKEALCLLISEQKMWLPWVTENIMSISKSTCHFSLWIINDLVTVYKMRLKLTTAIVIHIFIIPSFQTSWCLVFWITSDIVQLNLTGNPGKTAFSTWCWGVTVWFPFNAGSLPTRVITQLGLL